jgi:hypothetical protein
LILHKNGLKNVSTLGVHYSILDIALSHENVSKLFKNKIIADYLCFVLKLGFGPNEIYNAQLPSEINGLDVWRDLFKDQLKERFEGEFASAGKYNLGFLLRELDAGKGYVSNGRQYTQAIKKRPKNLTSISANRWRKCMGIEPTYPLPQKVHRI